MPRTHTDDTDSHGGHELFHSGPLLSNCRRIFAADNTDDTDSHGGLEWFFRLAAAQAPEQRRP